MDSNPTRKIAIANAIRFAPKKFASSAPTDAPTAVAAIRSTESVSVAPRVDLHHDQGRDRGPVGLGHLHEPRDYDRPCRSDGCANRVRNRRKVLLVPNPEFHPNMIIRANQLWQDRRDRPWQTDLSSDSTIPAILLGYSLERGTADHLARGIGKSHRRAIATVL